MKVFCIDVAYCNGCYNCQIACKDEHCEVAWPPYTAPQPLIGQFWCKLDQKTRGKVPWVRVAYTPVICGHCEDAPCEKVATDGAVYRRDDGLVVIDPDKAKGQRAIAEACPLGAVYYNEELELPQKCTGCAHLLDDGWSSPRCVDACATGALRYGEEEEFDLTDCVCLDPLNGLGSHVYYRNLPKRWVAGCVVDFAKDEVVIGAAVDLLLNSKVCASLKTDEFGDFKFEQVEAEKYELKISIEGYATTTIDADARGDDVVLGDLALETV
jgi:Fe-S-cluster-containing dehydrogenase component